jgi:hypothetical protein
MRKRSKWERRRIEVWKWCTGDYQQIRQGDKKGGRGRRKKKGLHRAKVQRWMSSSIERIG